MKTCLLVTRIPFARPTHRVEGRVAGLGGRCRVRLWSRSGLGVPVFGRDGKTRRDFGVYYAVSVRTPQCDLTVGPRHPPTTESPVYDPTHLG